jgi:hypothetical protein
MVAVVVLFLQDIHRLVMLVFQAVQVVVVLLLLEVVLLVVAQAIHQAHLLLRETMVALEFHLLLALQVVLAVVHLERVQVGELLVVLLVVVQEHHLQLQAVQ